MTPKREIKAVVFDLDGTLVNLNIDFKALRAEIVEHLVKQGLPYSIFSLSDSVSSILDKIEVYMRNNGRNKDEILKLKNEVLSIVINYEMEAARKTSLIPGVLETLKTLKDMGLKTAIFTANGEKAANYILKKFRIKEFFDVVVAREAVSSVKPNPMHLKAVLEALNVKPKETLVVGDSEWDMKCARENGVTAVGVVTGFSSPEQLKRAGASYIISSLTNIPPLLHEIQGSA